MIQLQLHPIPASPQFASASDDEDSMDGQFASLSVFGKLPGVRDVLVSPTNSVGSIRNGSLCLPVLQSRFRPAPPARSVSPACCDSTISSAASSVGSSADHGSLVTSLGVRKVKPNRIPLTIRIPPSIQASRQPPLLSARQSDSADKLPASPLQLVIVSRPHPSPRRAAALKRQRGAVLVPGSVARAWRAQGFGAVRVENGAKGLAIRAF